MTIIVLRITKFKMRVIWQLYVKTDIQKRLTSVHSKVGSGSLIPYQQKDHTTANWYAIAFSIEAGWEWEIAGKSRIGLQAYCNIGANNKYKKDSFTPFIQVEPIADTTDPVPQVTVGWADPLYTTPMYLDFGIRAYYVLPIGKL